MNEVLELLRRKYDIPKDVLHLIVHMFRPRPPSYYGKVLEKWDRWKAKAGDPFILASQHSKNYPLTTDME